jgi:hypothetical protein
VPDALKPAGVSPMAASVMKPQSQPPAPRPPVSPSTAPPPQPQGHAQPAPQQPFQPAAPAGPAQYAAPAAQQSHPFAPGTLVLVYWADGNRYPGTVLQIAQHHVFVAFPNGTQQWVDARYVQAGA